MRLRTVEKERVQYPMDACLFRTLKYRVYQRLSQTFADRVLWNGDLLDLPRSFAGGRINISGQNSYWL